MMDGARMMPCEAALERLWDYVDGELVPADEQAVREHLEICNRCYPEYDYRRAYFEFTRRLQRRERVRPELRRRLFELILRQESSGADVGGAPHR